MIIIIKTQYLVIDIDTHTYLLYRKKEKNATKKSCILYLFNHLDEIHHNPDLPESDNLFLLMIGLYWIVSVLSTLAL